MKKREKSRWGWGEANFNCVCACILTYEGDAPDFHKICESLYMFVCVHVCMCALHVVREGVYILLLFVVVILLHQTFLLYYHTNILSLYIFYFCTGKIKINTFIKCFSDAFKYKYFIW